MHSKTLAFHLRWRNWTIYNFYIIPFLEQITFDTSDRCTNISKHFLRINKNFSAKEN